MLLDLLLPVSVGAESYLCIAELSAGFIYEENTKEWEAVTGKGEDKFVVSEPVEDDWFYRQAKCPPRRPGFPPLMTGRARLSPLSFFTLARPLPRAPLTGSPLHSLSFCKDPLPSTSMTTRVRRRYATRTLAIY